MSDIVERLRNPHLQEYVVTPLECEQEILSLRQQLAAADEDNKALSFNSQGTIVKLRQQLADQKKITNMVYRGCDPVKKQLAECQEVAASSQAREKVFRQKVIYALAHEGFMSTLGIAINEAIQSSQPSDSIALDTMLKHAKREALLEAMQICLKAKDNFPMMSASADNAYFLISRMAKELE
jgi:hypothetical protein